jgi:polysaccharide export outer membrane protein
MMSGPTGAKQHPSLTLMLRALALAGTVMVLAACGSSGQNADALAEFQEEQASQSRVDAINEQLLTMAVTTTSGDEAYRIGAGDQIMVDIFNVPELSRDYRVDAMGNINMPLVGQVSISGYDLGEAETLIAEAYGERYLRNPQVSISIMEFRSQQFTAIGALASPRIYNTDRQVTLMEAIAMSGGLAGDAGTQIYLTDRVRDPETGELGTRSVIIGVEDLMSRPEDYNFFIGEGALINVPRAGSIFVEGAVERPGVYQRTGDTTVLKAIAMAGGLKFEASRSNLRVLRRDPATNEWLHNEVTLSDIRESPDQDITLRDGDILMVEYGVIRTAWTGGLRLLRDVAFLGFRPF